MIRANVLLLFGAAAMACAVLSGCGGGQEEPEGHLVAGGINDGGYAAVPAQTDCPVCGAPIKRDVYAEEEEGRVYFDSDGCLEEWNRNPDEYADRLRSQAQPSPFGEPARGRR